MPIVPTFQGGVPQVRDNGGSGFVPARAPAVNVDAYGRMMQQAMKPVEEWSNSLTEALRIEHQRTVKAESDDAERQVIDAINARMSGENGYMTQQGKNAMDAFQPTVEGMTADVDKIVGSLQPQVREVIGSRIQDRLSSAVEQARRWNGQQTRAYHLQSSEARVQSLMTDADNHYAETAYLQKTWGSITQEIDYQAAMMGLPAEQVKLLKDRSYDLFTARRFEAWGSDNPVLALQAFKSQRPKVSADIAAKIESGLFSKSRDTLALGLAQRPVRYSTTEEFEEQDFTDQYNTQLTPEEEREFQAWAKAEGRERDVFNYDLRGAWKELKSGTMSEDARGHLGDKYKKPNHPTFSDQSIYSTEENRGGYWSVENGQDVFVPGRELSAAEANYLQQYFAEREPGVQLKARVKESDGALVDDWYTNPSSLTGDPFIDSLKNDQRLSVVLRARQLRSQMIQMRGDEFNTQVKNNLAEALLGNNPEKMALDQFTEAYGPKKGLKQFKQYEIDYEEAQFKFNARNLSADEIAKELKAFKPKAGDENFADKMKAWEAMNKAGQAIIKDRDDDPIQFVMDSNDGALPPIKNWDQESSFRSLLERVPLAQTVSQRWKTEAVLLSKKELGDLTDHFESLDASGQVQFIGNLYAALKVPASDEVGTAVNDFGIGTLVSQLADNKAGKRLGAALMLMADTVPDMGKKYLFGKQMLSEGNAQISEKYGGDIAWFNEKIGTDAQSVGVFDESADADLARDAFTGVFAFDQQDGGTRDATFTAVFGNVADYNGKKILLPRRKTNNQAYSGDAFWWFTRDFNDLMDASVKRIGKEKGYVVFEGYRQDMETFARLIKNRQLQTVGNGRYLVKSRDQSGYARNVDGSYFVLDVLAR